MNDRIRQLEQRVAMLEGMVSRAYSAVGNPALGAVPEVMVVDSPASPPTGDPAQVMPFPGALVVIPPGCNVVVLDAQRDPVVVAGTGTPAALKAAAAIASAHPAMAAGGIAILDPLLGTGGLVITPGEVDVIGVLKVNGTPVTVP